MSSTTANNYADMCADSALQTVRCQVTRKANALHIQVNEPLIAKSVMSGGTRQYKSNSHVRAIIGVSDTE